MMSLDERADGVTSELFDPTAHVLYEAVTQMGGNPKNAAGIVKMVERLSIGLPAEDEFAAILSWLGHCKLIQKVDQTLVSHAAQNGLRIPDFLVIFEYEGHDLPVLIEVKTSRTSSLSWRPDIFEGLQAYGRALGLPTLLAWKSSALGFWCLVDLDRFERPQTNFKLAIWDAMKANLLSHLAGDFGVTFQAGVGIHFEMQKLKTIRQVASEKETTEEVLLRIRDAYFSNGDGERISRIGGGLWSLLLAAQLEDQTTATEDGYNLSFVVPPDQFGCWAQTALTGFVAVEEQRPTETAYRWRRLLKEQSFPFQRSQVREAATSGINQKLIRYVFDLQPDIIPDWLK